MLRCFAVRRSIIRKMQMSLIPYKALCIQIDLWYNDLMVYTE